MAPGSEGLKNGCSEVVTAVLVTGALGVEKMFVLVSNASNRANFSSNLLLRLSKSCFETSSSGE